MDIYECFSAVDMRVGTVQKVELNERARVPAYKMWIDFGFLGVKTSSGQYVVSTR
jgi:tRNA-binding protein